MNADDVEDMQRRRICYALEPMPHRCLPHYKDWLRGSEGPLWCEVLRIEPELLLRWRYSDAQELEFRDVPWRCSSVWFHAAWLPQWRLLQGDETAVFKDLEDAINTLVGNRENTKYTLLVNPDGLLYDRNRLGGDHHVTLANGKKFCFSVRKGVRKDDKILLAIAF